MAQPLIYREKLVSPSFVGHFDRYTLFSGMADHSDKDLIIFKGHFSARSFLGEFAADPSTMRTFREVLHRDHLGCNVFRMTDSEVIKRLAWELVLGAVKIAEAQPKKAKRGGIVAGRSSIGEELQAAGQTPSAVEEKTWIEIKLIDGSDQPVPDETFEIEFPDGSKKRGKTNLYGFARYTGLESGECWISFLDLDPDKLERA